jgi:hypothetical protein
LLFVIRFTVLEPLVKNVPSIDTDVAEVVVICGFATTLVLAKLKEAVQVGVLENTPLAIVIAQAPDDTLPTDAIQEPD